MVVLDMVDGSEYIIPAGPTIAQQVNDCIERAAHACAAAGGRRLIFPSESHSLAGRGRIKRRLYGPDVFL